MNDNGMLNLGNAVSSIKDAIVRSRLQAAKLVNKELLSLYYGVGKYVSDNSREGQWGKRAIKLLSNGLQKELPGLRGFSESSIKLMRTFFEEWKAIFANRQLSTGDLEHEENRSLLMNDLCKRNTHINRPLVTDGLSGYNFNQKHQSAADELIAAGMSANRPLITDDFKEFRQLPTDELQMVQDIENDIDLNLLSKHLISCNYPESFIASFYGVGFTHHSEILAKEKSLEGRLFYMARCAEAFWTVETLKSHLRGNLYSRLGTMPNNFMQTLPESEQARRAIRVFKDEYLLDFINLDDEFDIDEREERVFERNIIADIRKFMLSFGNKFCYIGNQYRIMVDGQEFFIDILFFHRELRCLVAVELKRGKFNPSHLGQLNFYLSALDEYVKQDDEAPSIGILLCKEASKNIVEFAVRDFTKPMGVATYRTRDEMPDEWKNALPDVEDMRKLLDTASDETDAEVSE